ncbi:PDZ domain (Also known as DHR or GLGF) [Caloramator quimbayensis]|uniref:PDZ domain (Also known as DHR or GLGF) n=1 Tax=Caloramator quimbayensis TaxID=1147123 RepID=A0A1T4XFV6_9CLOT|nr:PDZ domain-containing protein [Caloramator quimbayensis]SKA88078.1 PDZ domain (Also known as DHR or GLGF) [Caloramator quimbayensis]
MDIINLIGFAFKSYANGVVGFLLDPIAWIFLFIIIGQYRKFVALQQNIYGGLTKQSTKELVTTSVLFGIISGLIGTIITTTFGVTFYKANGLSYLILLSLLLMLISPRYVCLSYSGGILSLFVLILSAFLSSSRVYSSFLYNLYNALEFDVPALMAIIAVMHFMESVLMWLDGGRGAVPVFMKQGEEIVGAFIMQRFWIIPIILYFFVSKNYDMSGVVTTPEWWPLIKSPQLGDFAKDAVFMATPLIAMLGYSDFAVTTITQKKVKRSAIGLSIFSITLLVLSFLATKFYVFNYVAALFAPLAHEGLILYERYKEKHGIPLYKKRDDGIIVLDTMPNSPAESMGLKPGDVIMSINNKEVREITDVDEIFNEYPSFLWVEIKDIEGEKKVLEFRDYKNTIKDLGVITIPDNILGVPYVEEKNISVFDRIKRKFK